MEELIRAVFEEGVILYEFFIEYFKKVYNACLEEFLKFSECFIIVSFLFEDMDVCYTFELSKSGYRVEEGDMIDFFIFMIVVCELDWKVMREDLFEVAFVLYASEECF